MPRSYRYISNYEKEILELKSENDRDSIYAPAYTYQHLDLAMIQNQMLVHFIFLLLEIRCLKLIHCNLMDTRLFLTQELYLMELL